MTELPSRLTRQIDKILAASLEAKATGPMPDVVENDQMSGESEDAGSSLINSRLVAEGSSARPAFVDPNGVAAQSQSTGNGAASRTQTNKGGRAKNDQPLTEQEKRELLYILQQSDPNMTMAEIDYLVNGIARGEITDVTFESLRKVIAAAKEHGVEIVSGIEPAPPPPATPSEPTPPAGTGNSNSGGSNTEEEPTEPRNPGGATGSPQPGSGGTTGKEPPWADEPGSNPGAGTGTGGTTSGAGVTKPEGDDDLQQALGTVSEVQEELEDVQEVIQEVRDVVKKINYHIGKFRASPTYLLEIGELQMSREMVLTKAFREDIEAQAEEDEERFMAVKFKEKMDKRKEIIEDTAEAESWRRAVTDSLDLGNDRRKNPEAEVV